MGDQAETIIFFDDDYDDGKNIARSSEGTSKKDVVYTYDDNVEHFNDKGDEKKRGKSVNVQDVKQSVMYTYKRIDSSCSTLENTSELPAPIKVDHNYSDVFSGSVKTEKVIQGQVKTINELKKVIPKVKLLPPEVDTLKELSKLSQPSRIFPSKQQLTNYCRTCAGLKIPLVDIFGEKGIQMRLNQQMKHLEEINEHDGLSTQMCMDCICDLKMSYKFFMQIKKAQVKLKSLLNVSANEEKALRTLTTPETTPKKRSETDPTPASMIPEDFLESSEKVSSPLSKLSESVENESSENESIEEFDPDDATEFPDLDESKEEKEIDENLLLNPTDVSTISEDKSESTVYQYDTDSNTYIKMKSEENLSNKPEEDIDDEKSLGKIDETISDIYKPSVALKRKALNSRRDSLDSQQTSESIKSLMKSVTDPKIQKLVQNPLNVSPSNEDGIMYVTVKGSKPNELLLVKVKKMDKNVDKKEEIKPLMMKKSFDLKPLKSVEKVLKSLSTSFKPSDSPKKMDCRGAIIEQQIEQYKKKREQILGGSVGLPNALKFEDGAVRFVNPVQHIPDNIKEENFSDNELKLDRKIKIKSSSIISISDDGQITTKEYLMKLARIKQKWEEAKKRKQALQQQLNESYSEGNMGKLTRILGEKEKNIQDFQEYLKQRRIVITKLKDEDIISLYEDRNTSAAKQKFPDLIDENIPVDGMIDIDFLDCDYCIQTFSSRDILEEHIKSHDYKIFYFCEDCGQEFLTNKAKRVHNVTCLKKLVCKYCDFMLESKGKKRQHEQKHCDAMYGQLCDICGEKFKHQGTLDQHIKTQHMSWEKIFQCPKCPKKFAFKQKLSFHLKSVHTTMRAYLCEDCGADFKNPASLRHHRIRKHQPSGNKRECPVCHKMVPFYSLSKHMYTHKAYTIQCPHCDKMFKNSSTLKQHVRIHEDQRQYRCDTCGVGFNRRDGLRLHMRVHQKSDSRALKECSCQICSEKFPNHSMLVIHRNRVHKDGKQYTCHICNRSMLSTRSLEWHMSHIHNETPPGFTKEDAETPTEKKRVTCNHCDKTFKTEMILRTHIKNTHMEKNPVKCLDCEMTFTSEVRLRHHMMVTHNRLEGTLTCPHCPKRFVNQLRLKTHMISHSEDRPYTCEICGFNLKTKIQLIKHHQNRHSDERPLQCRYCPWRCKQVSALVCHERTHTNERPYSCIVCKQRFKYLGDKNKHERRHESLGGSGFKRIVTGRNVKGRIREAEGETSEEQEQDQYEEVERQLVDEEYEEAVEEFDTEEQIVKFEAQEIDGEYEQDYQQEYEETSREASEAAEVIMSMEDTTVYTEEVTADNIEAAEMITDEIMTSQILQAGTVVHLQQQDDDGKIQVIPVMLSLPDLTDAGSEVNLATASIMYNN